MRVQNSELRKEDEIGWGPAEVGSARPLPVGSFAISYRGPDGRRVRRSLADAVHLPFYDFKPIRRYPAHRRQRHMPGLYWFATTGRHVGCESRLEARVLALLDFDPVVEAVAAQPFLLHATPGGSREVDHVPDFIALLESGQSRVIDVTPAELRDRPERREKFELTARACELAGWQYALETEPDPVLLANVLALAGFRREPIGVDRFIDGLLEACKTPTTIGTLSEAVGPRMLVRPVIFHLLWKQLLIVDLTARLRDDAIIAANTAAGAGG